MSPVTVPTPPGAAMTLLTSLAAAEAWLAFDEHPDEQMRRQKADPAKFAEWRRWRLTTLQAGRAVRER